MSDTYSLKPFIVVGNVKAAHVVNYVLQDRLIQELKFGQLSIQVDKVVACCHFLLRFGNTKLMEYALRLLDNIKDQLSPTRLYTLLRSTTFQQKFALVRICFTADFLLVGNCQQEWHLMLVICI